MKPRLFTYWVFFPGEPDVEEIDVTASSEREALRLATEEALDLYPPNFRLEPAPPGGSGGMMTIISL